jgi:hypothetical protein
MVYQGQMFNAFRDGKVMVCKRQCSTCIFGPKSPIGEERRNEMVQEATRRESAIICHATLGGDNAVCRGFFERHKTAPLQIAERLGVLQEVNGVGFVACSAKGCWRTLKAGTVFCLNHQPSLTESQKAAEKKRVREFFAAREWHEDRKKWREEVEDELRALAEFEARHAARLL